jgi:hypothetical protein
MAKRAASGVPRGGYPFPTPVIPGGALTNISASALAETAALGCAIRRIKPDYALVINTLKPWVWARFNASKQVWLVAIQHNGVARVKMFRDPTGATLATLEALAASLTFIPYTQKAHTRKAIQGMRVTPHFPKKLLPVIINGKSY